MTAPSRLAERARRSRRDEALARPDLRAPSDGFARAPSAGATSPMRKVVDPATRAAIEEFLARRAGRAGPGREPR